MNVRPLVAVIMAGALTAPATAVAQTRYPNQRPAHDPWLQQMVDAAGKFWDSRAVTGCVPELDVADSLADTDTTAHAAGRGWFPGNGCTIALDAQWAGRMLADARRPYRHWRRGIRLQFRRGALQGVCAIIFHEYGHARGLQHTVGGLMDAHKTVVPGDCIQLSHRIIRRTR